MVVTRRMARENASRNNDSNSDASDSVAADQPSTAAVYRDAARDNVRDRVSSPRNLPIDNDDSQPQNHIENDTIPACSRTPIHRSRAAPHRRGRKTTSSSKPHLAKQATTKAGVLNTPNEVSSNEDASQRPPVKRGERRRREGGEAEESNKENSANDDCETVPKSVRRIRRRAAKAPNDESETTPTNKASLFAAGDSSNRDFLRCVSSCSEHPEADTIAACALVELSSGKLIQEDEIRNAVYRFASGRKLKMVHPVPTVIA